MSDFDIAWKEMEKRGFQYGKDALEQVRLGWHMRDDELAAARADVERLTGELKYETEARQYLANQCLEQNDKLLALREKVRGWAVRLDNAQPLSAVDMSPVTNEMREATHE